MDTALKRQRTAELELDEVTLMCSSEGLLIGQFEAVEALLAIFHDRTQGLMVILPVEGEAYIGASSS